MYSRPILRDLSQGARIAFVRQFRGKAQDEIAGLLGAIGECRRITMTRYEKRGRNPKEERTNREVSYNEYLEWKLNYKIEECCEYERNN